MAGKRREQAPVEVLTGKTGQEVMEEGVMLFRKLFYPETLPTTRPSKEQALFFQDRALLRQAVTYPAHQLKERGWGELRQEDYMAMLRKVAKKIALHGTAMVNVRRRGAYILHCVQDEWQHHWDDYYDQAKARAADVERALKDLQKRGEMRPADERPIDVLAAAHELVRVQARGGRRKAAPPEKPREIQTELF